MCADCLWSVEFRLWPTGLPFRMVRWLLICFHVYSVPLGALSAPDRLSLICVEIRGTSGEVLLDMLVSTRSAVLLRLLTCESWSSATYHNNVRALSLMPSAMQVKALGLFEILTPMYAASHPRRRVCSRRRGNPKPNIVTLHLKTFFFFFFGCLWHKPVFEQIQNCLYVNT
jgi:hypothetical protein